MRGGKLEVRGFGRGLFGMGFGRKSRQGQRGGAGAISYYCDSGG